MLQFIDHSDKVLEVLSQSKEKALQAIGLTSVELTTQYMQTKYGKPIWQTGDLQRDLNFRVHEDSVTIGNSLEYAPFIHMGTVKLKGRPYLFDAVTQNIDVLKEVANEEFI